MANARGGGQGGGDKEAPLGVPHLDGPVCGRANMQGGLEWTLSRDASGQLPHTPAACDLCLGACPALVCAFLSRTHVPTPAVAMYPSASRATMALTGAVWPTMYFTARVTTLLMTMLMALPGGGVTGWVASAGREEGIV